MITQEEKEVLKEMRREMQEKSNANHKGRIIDQIEFCYKQYTPKQNLGR